MAITVLKTKFEKSKPKTVLYRDYKKFNEIDFRNDLTKFLSLCISYDSFEKIFMEVLELHAPLKTKLLRANEAPYMTKALKKAIMKRTELESKYYRTKCNLDKSIYKKQKNYVSRLYKNEIKKFYQNLDIKNFLDNKKFWKNVKPLFSDKGAMRQQISIVQGNQIISDNKEVAETFNKYFVHVIDSLQLKISPYLLNPRIYTGEFKDPIDRYYY